MSTPRKASRRGKTSKTSKGAATTRRTKRTTRARRPPSRPSDEADRQQLRMAKREGKAYGTSLRYMVDEVADAGDTRRAGNYVVGFAQEKAEGMYHLHAPGHLMWMEPGKAENCHLEISVTDATDGRFIPYLDITALLVAADGTQVGPVKIPFVWHPGLYHYGKNLTVPGSGRYALHVRVEPPRFHRHDKVNGRRYADVVDVEFANVKIKTGRE